MSDSMKKKWRNLKKNRASEVFDTNKNELGEDNQVESQLHDKTNDNIVVKETDSKLNNIGRSSAIKPTDRFECIKCNLVILIKHIFI